MTGPKRTVRVFEEGWNLCLVEEARVSIASVT